MSHSLKRKRTTSTSRKQARTGVDTVPTPVGSDMYADFLRTISGEDPLPPTRSLVGTPTVAPTQAALTTVIGPKPKNPFAGKVKNLRGNFGTGYHDIAHFQETSEKANHGVWQAKLPQVKKWVKMALDSIYADDRFVVAAKSGTNGGYTYLISMDGTTVGYLSGSSAQPGEKKPAQHIEVYLDRKGNTVSAFPSAPDIF